jgi:hypothetical protein
MTIDINDEAVGISRHINLRTDEWWVAKYRKKDCPFIGLTGDKLHFAINKNFNERVNDKINGKHTTHMPIQEEVLNNIITNIGMQESLDRDIAVASTSIDWLSLGTGTNAEDPTNTALQTELTDTAYARLRFSTEGSRTRTNQTATYAMLADHTILDSPPTTINEAGLEWNATKGTANTIHARAKFSSGFPLDTGDILVIRATELQANGTI